MRKIIISLLLIANTWLARADEGMWIPMLLEELNISRMQSLGLKLSAEDIYSVNHSSLKDAIVQFGGGCTAEFVSSAGLVLTNHHCGLGVIQRLSSLENDYLRNGFWARNYEEELPATGMTVTLLVRMEDVTSQVLEKVLPSMTQLARSQMIRQNIDSIEKRAMRGNKMGAQVRSFFYGNQYYLFLTKTFKDVRLVGAPPSAIGQFGGDTDNWMWPRHGADFSLFRIYADSANEPAAYSAKNVPYKPAHYLPVSLKGYQKGDFTFVFGYPGTTREYLTSLGVDQTANIENPVRIRIREKKLAIYNEAMDASPGIRIQYTSKHQGIANGWKKMLGETRGIKRINAVEKKQAFEKQFAEWSAGETKYNGLLDSFRNTYEHYRNTTLASVYFSEAGLGIEMIRFAGNFRDLLSTDEDKNKSEDDVKKIVQRLFSYSRSFFKDYNREIDKKVAVQMLGEMQNNLPAEMVPFFDEILKKHINIDEYVAWIYKRSLLADSAQVFELLNSYSRGDAKKLKKDEIFKLASLFYEKIEDDINPEIIKFNTEIDSLQRIYMAAQMEMQKDRIFYPDANSTLRISFGKVDDYFPADAVHYHYYTTTDGILEKEDPAIYDYAVDDKLKELLRNRDFGRYADKDGTMHIAFIASNHTTGGNSGSPVLDAYGNLIGINYDRNWEGTMSDLMYDPLLCRNISLDIRYCLFIIDKYAGAGHLLSEMTIIDGDQTTLR